MKINEAPHPNMFKVAIRVIVIALVTAIILAIPDGISALFNIGMAGLLTGPFTFLWWPYFRTDIGFQPFLGIIPIFLIISGLYYHANKLNRILAYIGGILWPIIGFIYIITHSL
jgi:hypothetical protein